MILKESFWAHSEVQQVLAPKIKPRHLRCDISGSTVARVVILAVLSDSTRNVHVHGRCCYFLWFVAVLKRSVSYQCSEQRLVLGPPSMLLFKEVRYFCAAQPKRQQNGV